MDFSKDQHQEKKGLRELFGIVILCLFTVLNCFSSLTAQEYALDYYTSPWTDNNSWVDGPVLNTSNIKLNIFIYGNIRHIGNIFFNNEDLHVYEDPGILGDLIFGNKSDLFTFSGGIVIVGGDSVS